MKQLVRAAASALCRLFAVMVTLQLLASGQQAVRAQNDPITNSAIINSGQRNSYTLGPGDTFVGKLVIFPVLDSFTSDPPNLSPGPALKAFPLDYFTLVRLRKGVTYKLVIEKLGGNNTFDVEPLGDKSRSVNNVERFELPITIPKDFIGPVAYGPIIVASSALPSSLGAWFISTTTYSITLIDPDAPTTIGSASGDVHPDGTLIKSPHDQTVYLLENRMKRGFPSAYHFNSWFFGSKHSVILVNDNVLNSYAVGPNMPFKDGTLLKYSDKPEDQTIFVVENGYRRAFQSWQDFVAMGYQAVNVMFVPSRFIDEVPRGHDVVSTVYNHNHNFEGHVDGADCNVIRGWVGDKNNLNTTFDMEVFADGVSLGRTPASDYRPDVGSYLKDNGFHGFSFTTPQALKDGQSHQVSVRVVDFNYLLKPGSVIFNPGCSGGPPPTPTPTPTPSAHNYVGYFDWATCDSIGGWAADRNRLGTSISVSIYDGDTLLMTVPANQMRPDVGSYMKDNGLHGFSIPTPTALKSGNHVLSVRYESSSMSLGTSPKALACTTPTPTPTPQPAYQGYHDFVDCNNIGGWVRDKNNSSARLAVSVFDDTAGTLIATGIANQFRQDLVNAGIGDGKYGFTIPTPASMRDGKQHSISVKVTNSAFRLIGTPRAFNSATSCSAPTPTPTPIPATPVYAGYIDMADCNSIAGWAADRNRLNSSINVSLYDGNTLLTTVLANQLRPDVGAYLKDNGLHGFTFPVPAALKNGQAHSINVRFESSATGLPSSPKAITCTTSPPPTVTGYSWSATPVANQPFGGTVSGTNFVAGGTQVWFCQNGSSTCYQHPSAGVNVNGPGGLSVSGVNLAAGSWQLFVRTSAGQSARSTAFAVQSPPSGPTVTGHSWNTTPRAGQPFGGTISGSGFISGATQVWFCTSGNSACYQHPSAGVTVNNSTSLSVSGVNLAGGLWQFYVQTSAGQSGRSTSFAVQAAVPTISGYSWSPTPVANRSFGGTVTGAGFVQGATQVWFCISNSSTCYQHPSAGVSVNNAGGLSVSGVNLSSGWWQFYLVTPAGQSARSASFNVQPGPPTISAYSWNATPTAGQPFGGSISGAEFIIGGTQIWFCVNGSSTCYQHPSAGINVNNSSGLSVNGVNLSSGWWQFYLQTSAGQSGRSTPFSVR
jgi:hypothetical protein